MSRKATLVDTDIIMKSRLVVLAMFSLTALPGGQIGCTSSSTTKGLNSAGGTSSGGNSATGGTTSGGGTGGATSSGGNIASGGTPNSGGTTGSGGNTSSDGATSPGGTTGGGGATKAGGAGGVLQLGGATGSGGTTANQGGTIGASGGTTKGDGSVGTGGIGGIGPDAGKDVALGSDSSGNAGVCEYECTDFCLNSNGQVMPGTCSKAGYTCCNIEAVEVAATGKQYYIDPAGSDSNDGSSSEKAWKSLTKISSATAGSIVNLKRGGVWETSGAINVTNLTVRPYGKGPRPLINGKKIIVPQSLGTIVLKGKSILDAVKVTSDQGFGAYINGNDNIMRNVEVDGTGTSALMGIGIVGNNNKVNHCYVHDLTVNTGDTGDVNSSGGAEGIVAFGGSHLDVGYNTVARAHCANKTLGGDEGGCTEIIMNPLFFSQYGKTMEDIQFHHNLCVDTVGLFESCQGTGDPGFDPTKDPGTIKDVTVAYNVVLDSKWMYLAQIVNTIHKNVVFEHNTIIHGPRNDKQWSTDAMSHEYMFGMMFSASNGTSVSDSLTADQMIVRNNMFWDPFTKESVLIGVTSGHNNNLFGPSTLNLEKRWVLDATEKKVDDLGLVDVFHPTATSPAVDKASTTSLFDTDFYGNAKCGSAPDIGAVEFCENSASKAKSDEVAKYLQLNAK